MRLSTISVFLLVALGACATEVPTGPDDPCPNQHGARGFVTFFLGGRSGLDTFEAKSEACEENYKAEQAAVKVCSRAVEEHMTDCGEACGKVHPYRKAPDDADALKSWAMDCTVTLPACRGMEPCIRLGTEQTPDDYDKLACLSSVADVDSVCNAMLNAVSNTDENGRADVKAARQTVAPHISQPFHIGQPSQPRHVTCFTTGPDTDCQSWSP